MMPFIFDCRKFLKRTNFCGKTRGKIKADVWVHADYQDQ